MTEGASAGPKGGKKGRKHGRNKAACAAYKLSNSAAMNKARRIVRHLATPGKDHIAVGALQRLAKADSKVAKAYGTVTWEQASRYDRQMASFAKRAAKAKRQHDRADVAFIIATKAMNDGLAIQAERAKAKAMRYFQHYSR